MSITCFFFDESGGRFVPFETPSKQSAPGRELREGGASFDCDKLAPSLSILRRVSSSNQRASPRVPTTARCKAPECRRSLTSARPIAWHTETSRCVACQMLIVTSLSLLIVSPSPLCREGVVFLVDSDPGKIRGLPRFGREFEEYLRCGRAKARQTLKLTQLQAAVWQAVTSSAHLAIAQLAQSPAAHSAWHCI